MVLAGLLMVAAILRKLHHIRFQDGYTQATENVGDPVSDEMQSLQVRKFENRPDIGYIRETNSFTVPL